MLYLSPGGRDEDQGLETVSYLRNFIFPEILLLHTRIWLFYLLVVVVVLVKEFEYLYPVKLQ